MFSTLLLVVYIGVNSVFTTVLFNKKRRRRIVD